MVVQTQRMIHSREWVTDGRKNVKIITPTKEGLHLVDGI